MSSHSVSSSDCVCLPKTKLNERKRERERERERERGKDTPATMATRGAAAPNCCVVVKSRGGKKRLDFSTSSSVRDRPRDHHHHHHHHRIQSCNDVECSTSGGVDDDDERDEKKTMEEKNFEKNEASFTARHNATKKGAFASSLVASMLALHTSFDTNGMMILDQTANATEQRRQMFDIALEEETSSSQQQQTPPAAPAMKMMKAAAKPEEMKPELGQGFFKDLEIFIEREPPIAVGFLFLFLINGVGGVIFTLFIRETNVGPGGEFGKVLAALRKEIIKEIFKFFGGALGRFTKEE